MTGAGIVAGLVYWTIAGRNAGAWREPTRPVRPAPLPSSPAAIALILKSLTYGVLQDRTRVFMQGGLG